MQTSLHEVVGLSCCFKHNGQFAELRLRFDLCVLGLFPVRARLPFTQAAES